MKSVTILQTNIKFPTQEELISLIKEMLKLSPPKKSLVYNTNAHALLLAHKDQLFQKCLNTAQINFCDGYGVILAARMQGEFSRLSRNTPPHFINEIFQFCCEKGLSVFMLGAKKQISIKTLQILKCKYPSLLIDAHHGYFTNKEEVISRINQFRPNLLLVGLGMPLQEKWLYQNQRKINFNAAMSVGALFDYISGHKKISPYFLSASGWEWAWRLIHEPIRLFHRYIIGLPLLYLFVIIETFIKAKKKLCK